MLLPLALLLLTLTAISAAAAWRTRQRQLERMRAEWARPRDQEREMAAIAEFFRAQHDSTRALDDRTWDDLLLDEVFAWIDRAESRVGQQLLYSRLRAARDPSLAAFEALVTRVSDEPPQR